jgi:hypothetical protein
LCLHSRIYPETKLATILGNYPFCLYGFLILCGHFLYLPFSLDLSVSESSGYPERPFGSISQFDFSCFFIIFISFMDSRNVSIDSLREPLNFALCIYIPVRTVRTLHHSGLREYYLLALCSTLACKHIS